jgi:hypothetical protein
VAGGHFQKSGPDFPPCTTVHLDMLIVVYMDMYILNTLDIIKKHRLNMQCFMSKHMYFAK